VNELLTKPPLAQENAPLPQSKAQEATDADKVQALLHSRSFAVAFGGVVALLARSSLHRHLSLADLEASIYPPLIFEQFLLAEAKLQTGQVIPVGVVFWARLSAEVDTRLSEVPSYPIRLQPDEWQSGDIFWIIDGAGHPEVIRSLIDQLATTVFAGKPFKLQTGEEGELSIVQEAARL
jgi:cytolysin-activating lysine-acyltransferase